MAANLLVTGSHGGDDPHVESKHDALMHAAMLGRSGYILKTRNWTMKPTAKDANNITIPAWDLVVEGRQIYIAAPTDVNIQSGSQGQKRRDLIVARYALNSGTGVETVTLEVIKGKPSAATPADPGIETGSIIGGAIVSDLPLCRVNLDGITITSIDTLVNVMQPLEDVWDSLTQPLLYAKFKWQDTKSFQPDAYGGGMQIVVDERNRLLHVDLSGFKSTVNLSHDYPVFQYASGVKPSKAMSLGCLWALPVGNWAKQATWNANGTIMVVGGLSNGDRCMHTPRTLPIPDGVTFS
jgi:hypothetical protein